MAFDVTKINRVSAGANTTAPAVHSYYAGADTGATVAGAGYFNDYAENLRIGTLIFVRASDGPGFYYVTAITPNVTVSALATIGVGGVGAAQIQAGAIDTVALADDAVTSDKLDASTIQYVNVPMTAAEFLGMNVAPKVLVAAGGANTLHVVDKLVVEFDWGAAQSANGGAIGVYYDDNTGTLASATIAAATVNAWVADSTIMVAGAIPDSDAAANVDMDLVLSNATAPFITGDSTFNLHLWYHTVTTGL